MQAGTMRFLLVMVLVSACAEELPDPPVDAGADSRDCAAQECTCNALVECIPNQPCDTGCPEGWTCTAQLTPDGLIGICQH